MHAIPADSEPEAGAARARRPGADAPVLIDVRDIHKTFRIPEHRVDTLKERLSRPGMRIAYRELHVLRGVSFDVRRGEFFGIVGRNGSGKSTLLKILASIYRADAGRIRMAGRLAPFIELGVGFDPELTARENVALNGVMMGLSRREAARRLDAVLDFAELREFVDLKLKNYSSGMMVRLAFAAMVEADADIMLVDEVLAVGDASFAQKCMDFFEERRRAADKTLIFVSHDMAAIQGICDRGMVLHDGLIRYIGDPEEVVLEYFRLNFGRELGEGEDEANALAIRLVDVWLEDDAGRRVEELQQGEGMSVNVVVEALQDLPGPGFELQCINVDGQTVFAVAQPLLDDGDEPRPVAAGERVRLTARVTNRLVPGRYSVTGSIARSDTPGDMAARDLRLLDFLVRGAVSHPGMVAVDARVEARLDA